MTNEITPAMLVARGLVAEAGIDAEFDKVLATFQGMEKAAKTDQEKAAFWLALAYFAESNNPE